MSVSKYWNATVIAHPKNVLITPASMKTDAINQAVAVLTMGMKPIVSREDYLEWVAAWKKLYQQVSDLLYNIKTYRDGTFDDKRDRSNSWEIFREYRQADVMKFKKYATLLINLRHMNKVIAKHSYEHYKAAYDKATS